MKFTRNVPSIPEKSGQVFTFGSAVSGELGLGKNIHERRKPGNLKTLNDVPIVAVECGGQHSLALDRNGNVYSWGVNDQGALGRETDEDEGRMAADSSDDEDSNKNSIRTGFEAWAPTKVDLTSGDPCSKHTGELTVVQMVCADSFSAVLTVNGEVYAWGSFRDPSGVIGFNKQLKNKSQKFPSKIEFNKEKVVLLGSGENHIFAVTSEDNLWAFGANDESQLGRRVSSRLKNNLIPYEIRGIGKKHSHYHNIVKITGGAFHTLYINSAGELYSFGCNNCGQLGLGDLLSHLSGPERVEYAIDNRTKKRVKLPKIIDIAAGESHSMALAADGRVFAWGANLEGQLGYKTPKPIFGDYRDEDIPTNGHEGTKSYHMKFQPLPISIPFGNSGLDKEDPILQIDAQSRFSIAVSKKGKLFTWGSGHSYQLGNEEMEDEEIPYQVELKTRKCFWAKCGGQFTMFLLDPKNVDWDYRTPAPVIPSSSMPNTPVFQKKTKIVTSEERESRRSKRTPEQSRESPTKFLRQTFENVCVSPERPKRKAVDKMAPWSPKKK